jgi:hypothetical protein
LYTFSIRKKGEKFPEKFLAKVERVPVQAAVKWVN